MYIFDPRKTLAHKFAQDVLYVAQVAIEGQSYFMQLDTGSSDLWVDSPNAVAGTQTPLTTNISYGIGYAYGPIAKANVSFAGFVFQSNFPPAL